MKSGRETGSHIATRKSLACSYKGLDAGGTRITWVQNQEKRIGPHRGSPSRNTLPVGVTQNGRLSWSGLSDRRERSTAVAKTPMRTRGRSVPAAGEGSDEC